MSEHKATPTAETVKAEARADAIDRAWRTFKQNILIDAAAATGTGVLVLMDKIDPTSPGFWPLVGGIALRSFVAAGASYLHRLKSDPAAK